MLLFAIGRCCRGIPRQRIFWIEPLPPASDGAALSEPSTTICRPSLSGTFYFCNRISTSQSRSVTSPLYVVSVDIQSKYGHEEIPALANPKHMPLFRQVTREAHNHALFPLKARTAAIIAIADGLVGFRKEHLASLASAKPRLPPTVSRVAGPR
ncbi:hypothetical protein GY45DRAFT_279009 [Cubamyces sp. BRFM 1775]|nr:hypothetical protein GY45DRAFT_279009 [Cubamyces sp. BRFM 1775]